MVKKTRPLIKRLFWDVEITPNVVLSFRVGRDQNINPENIVVERRLICIAYKWEHEKKVHVLKTYSDSDKQIILDFIEIAKEADELVAHFGDRADLPWTRARAVIHKCDPLPIFKTIDTCAWISKHFGFNCSKLGYISELLGHGGKEKMESDDWKKITLRNDPKSIDKMAHYCGVDVLRLEKVYQEFAPLMKPKTHAGVLGGFDKWTCPRDGSSNVKKNKTKVSAAGTVSHQMKCGDCGSYFTINDRAYRDYLEAKKKKR